MIRFSIILSADGRTETARQRIIDYVTGHGCELTAGGLVTLSFAGEPEAVAEVFGAALDVVRLRPERAPDMIGASAPHQQPELLIPDDLRPLIDHVSIPPPARHFSEDE